jgi:ABC-type dipeptide/oligopeptide/nickel transport system ATPase component
LRVLSGEIRFRGKRLILDQRRIWQEILGREILMLFQSPASALNPVIRIRDQIAEALVDVRACSRTQALNRSASLLEIVGVPLEKADAYPFQLSGGMRQRVLIAIALALEPSVLIADEPAVGLDAIHHAAVLDLLRNLNRERNVAMLIITHDLRTAAFLSRRAMVLFQGRNVESGSIPDLLSAPSHPYTRNLVESLQFLEGYRD